MLLGDVFNFAFLAHHLVLLGLFLVLALSLNLILGCAGMFNLGHQGFWATGAYAAGAVVLALQETLPGPVVFVLSLAMAILVSAVMGLVVSISCLRLRGDHVALATLAFAEITRVLLNNVEWLGGSRGLRLPQLLVARTPETTTLFFTVYLGVVGTALVLTLLLCRNLLRSSHGRAILSLREDEVAAELMGVPVARYKVLVFVLGAALAGLAGGIYAHFFGVLSPKDFGVMAGVLLVLMVVLGGAGSVSGTMLATVIIYSSQQLFKLRLLGIPTALAGLVGWLPLVDTATGLEDLAVERWQLAFALLLIALMLLAPGGLFGKGEIWDMAWFRGKSKNQDRQATAERLPHGP